MLFYYVRSSEESYLYHKAIPTPHFIKLYIIYPKAITRPFPDTIPCSHPSLSQVFRYSFKHIHKLLESLPAFKTGNTPPFDLP